MVETGTDANRNLSIKRPGRASEWFNLMVVQWKLVQLVNSMCLVVCHVFPHLLMVTDLESFFRPPSTHRPACFQPSFKFLFRRPDNNLLQVGHSGCVSLSIFLGKLAPKALRILNELGLVNFGNMDSHFVESD